MGWDNEIHRGPFIIKFHVRDDQLEKGNRTRGVRHVVTFYDRHVVTSAIVPDDVTAQTDLWYVLHHSSGHETAAARGETIHYRASSKRKSQLILTYLYQGGRCHAVYTAK